jgi:hypothetical protein
VCQRWHRPNGAGCDRPSPVRSPLLPRFGVRWSASGPDQVTASYRIADVPLEVHYRLDADGRVVSFVFDRWGDPDNTGSWSWHPFGGEITGYATFDGLTIPSAGRVGWFFGTDRWPASEFFRYQITDLHLVGGAIDSTASTARPPTAAVRG